MVPAHGRAAAEWDLRFVRGPKTARLTGAPFISGPAILLPRLLPFEPSREGLGFVPHFGTRRAVIEEAAGRLGARVIHPERDVEDFVRELTKCEKVICEAMHGAIIADAYRIPWAGLRLDVGFRAGAGNVFKWEDWCQSIQAPYKFAPLPLICYAPQVIRQWFRPEGVSGQPTHFDFGLSSESALAAAQDQILEEVERLKQSRPA